MVSKGNIWKHIHRDTKGHFCRDTESPGPVLRTRRGEHWAAALGPWLCCRRAQGNILEPQLEEGGGPSTRGSPAPPGRAELPQKDSRVQRMWELSGLSPRERTASKTLTLRGDPPRVPAGSRSDSPQPLPRGAAGLGTRTGEGAVGPGVHPTQSCQTQGFTEMERRVDLTQSRLTGQSSGHQEGHIPSRASWRTLVSAQHQDQDSDEVAPSGPTSVKWGFHLPYPGAGEQNPPNQTPFSVLPQQARLLPGSWLLLPPCDHTPGLSGVRSPGLEETPLVSAAPSPCTRPHVDWGQEPGW